jgi:hypothetical protein
VRACAIAVFVVAAAVTPHAQRAAAPVDLTGDWVSVVTEDWRWRMVTPPKGDVSSIPVNDAARKVADTWDPARDKAAGDQCKAYGAPGIMRIPGRIRISWENETTMKIETEAGTQTRLLRFGDQRTPQGQPSYQGHSVARWEFAGGRAGRGAGGSLSVTTTGMRAGYLRRNGVPYSERTTVEEYYSGLTEPNGERWLVVTTVVRDPQYLTGPWVTSTHFKKVANGSSWNPTPCEAD